MNRTLSRRQIVSALLAVTTVPNIAIAQQGGDPNNQVPTDIRIRVTFNGLALTATLDGNPMVRDLASLLPLDLKIEDFGSNEKIVHLPRKLTEKGSGLFTNERPGDLCYFKAWGNLALFHGDYRWDGLIRLGRFDDAFDALLTRGEYPVRIERL